MPQLDLAASRAFWAHYDDPMIYRVIAFMESVEDWTLDGNPELESIINEIGNSFDSRADWQITAAC